MIVSLLYPSYPCFNWKIARGWWACPVTRVPATPVWDLSLDPHRQISRARWPASLVNPRWAVGHWETMSQNTWWEAVEDALCHLQTHASACTCSHMPYHAHTMNTNGNCRNNCIGVLRTEFWGCPYRIFLCSLSHYRMKYLHFLLISSVKEVESDPIMFWVLCYGREK